MMKKKIIRIATVPLSLDKLLEGQLAFLNRHFKVVGVSSDGAQLKQVAKREGVRVLPIEMERSIAPLKDLVSLWKLYRLFRNEKPLMVHSITPKAGLLSMIAAYFANVPIRIHTFTGLVFPSKKGFLKLLLIQMDKFLCAFATHVYPEGKGVKNDLLKYKITKKPLKILANGNVNGINLEVFNRQNFPNDQISTLRTSLGIQENDFVFIFVGRLVGDKGINELIGAFKKLTANGQQPQAKLLLVGPFEHELDPLQSVTLNSIKNSPNIISVGYQDDVSLYFAIANVLVFPSYREGFPNVVLQAGAMELPSIVTNINGCNEIILEGKNGWVIPVKNEEALEQAMLNCVLDEEAFKYAKSNSRQMIKNRFQQKEVWEALLIEYNLLIRHYEKFGKTTK